MPPANFSTLPPTVRSRIYALLFQDHSGNLFATNAHSLIGPDYRALPLKLMQIWHRRKEPDTSSHNVFFTRASNTQIANEARRFFFSTIDCVSGSETATSWQHQFDGKRIDVNPFVRNLQVDFQSEDFDIPLELRARLQQIGLLPALRKISFILTTPTLNIWAPCRVARMLKYLDSITVDLEREFGGNLQFFIRIVIKRCEKGCTEKSEYSVSGTKAIIGSFVEFLATWGGLFNEECRACQQLVEELQQKKGGGPRLNIESSI